MTGMLFAIGASSIERGVRIGAIACTALVAVVAGFVMALYALGGARLHAPDLRAWLDDAAAYDSPPLAAEARSIDP